MRSKSGLSSLKLTLLGALLLGAAQAALANVRLPAIFSDHMVLQRDAPVSVWGWADAGERVTVSIAGQTKTTQAGADGRWMLKLDKLKACDTPQQLVVKGVNTITLNDVLVGEVWLGSGQSNMAMTVNRAKDYAQEQVAANFPLVRMFKEESGTAKTAQADGKGQWVLCAPETVGAFSATLYFFGREIHQKLNVPVGLINSSVGGTPIESWISPEAQHASKELTPFFEAISKPGTDAVSEAAKAKYERDLAAWDEAAKKARGANQKAPRKPRNPAAASVRKADVGGLYNGKIAPLIPYAIRGALWYQGEANTNPPKPPFYQHQLPLLVKDWRARWGYNFPFAWVQLPNFNAPGRDWPLVREAMLKSLKVPQTGMAITIDIGDPGNIHPTNKQEVGRRLSLWALGEVYGQKGVATSGPIPAGQKIRGGEVVLSFKHTDAGLVAKGGELKGFAIAGVDKQWLNASAKIVGDTVVVSHPGVKKPVAARYAWADNPDCNLFKGAGLSASPFRTDNWQ